jgi:alpha-tubulin suppressor-like RCC1 family protein
VGWCWGDNRFGQLGDGTLVNRSQPVKVVAVIGPTPGDLNFVKLSAGQDRTCGVIVAAQVWCWGSNGAAINSAFPNDQAGILGVGVLASPIKTPMQVVGSPVQWADVSAGYRYACGMTPAPVGALWCWGANTYTATRGGMIGDGSLVARLTPVLTATGAESFVSVGAGFNHACGLSAVGEAWCWGANLYGEVGDGGPGTDFLSNPGHPTPIKVVGGLRFASLSAAKLNTCGITPAGETWCWGYNAFGELGDGTTTNRTGPVKVSP